MWVASTGTSAAHYQGTGEIYKSTGAAFASWQSATPSGTPPTGTSFLTFQGADSVYTNGHHSADGGLTWLGFGPSIGGSADLIFDPADPQICYSARHTWGVQKTTDGGQTWEVKNQGLAAMYCTSVAVSPTDPLQVFGTFNNLPGIYRSDDGTSNWTYLPIAGSGSVGRVCEDPFDPHRLYAAAGTGLYVSTDEGETWSDLGWDTSPTAAPGGPADVMAADPHHAGHLLVALMNNAGPRSRSTPAATTARPGSPHHAAGLAGPKEITNIAFDPETPGLVYLTTPGKGIYQSTDSGIELDSGSMTGSNRTGERRRTTKASPSPLILGASCSSGQNKVPSAPSTAARPGSTHRTHLPARLAIMFVDGDSTRLYAATVVGLFFSSDAGDSWTRAAGVFGRLRSRPWATPLATATRSSTQPRPVAKCSP